MENIKMAEIINAKIQEFVENNNDKFVRLLAQMDRESRRILGGFYDKDTDNGTQLFLNVTQKIEEGDRNWDYENVKLEAMIFNSARSMLTDALRKRINQKKSFINIESLAGETNDETNEENKCSRKETEEVPTYTQQEIVDTKIKEMVIKEITKSNDDLAIISLEVIDYIETTSDWSYKEIAEELKIGDKDVKNAIDRIRRASRKVFEKLPELDKEYIENFKKEYRYKEIKNNLKKSIEQKL